MTPLIWLTFCSLFIKTSLGIINGEKVNSKDFQKQWYYVASVYETDGLHPQRGKFLCTATILTMNIAMTTASCITHVPIAKLRVNSDSSKSDLGGNGYENIHRLNRKFIHPKYDFAMFSANPDFKRPLSPSLFPPFTDPYDLPFLTDCKTAGFGLNLPGNKAPYTRHSKDLLTLRFKIKPRNPNHWDEKVLTPEIIWAKPGISEELLEEDNQGATTRGDRGGPLICSVNSAEHLVGIALPRQQRDGFSEFLNLSYVMREIRKFMELHNGKNQPRNSQISIGQGSMKLKAVCYVMIMKILP